MTDDPAGALANILEEWRIVPAGTSLEASRQLGDPNRDVGFWRFHAEVFDLIREVERAITLVGLQRQTGHYRKHLPSIYAAVAGFTVPFRNAAQQDRATIDDAAIDSLRMLSDVLHSMDAVTADTEQLRQEVAAGIGSVRALFDEFPELDRQSRAYLVALTAELEQALEDVDRFGTALIRRVSSELAGVLVGQAMKDDATGNKPRAQRAWEAAKQFGIIGATAVVTKAIDSGGDLILKQITSSSE